MVLIRQAQLSHALMPIFGYDIFLVLKYMTIKIILDTAHSSRHGRGRKFPIGTGPFIEGRGFKNVDCLITFISLFCHNKHSRKINIFLSRKVMGEGLRML